MQDSAQARRESRLYCKTPHRRNVKATDITRRLVCAALNFQARLRWRSCARRRAHPTQERLCNTASDTWEFDLDIAAIVQCRPSGLASCIRIGFTSICAFQNTAAPPALPTGGAIMDDNTSSRMPLLRKSAPLTLMAVPPATAGAGGILFLNPHAPPPIAGHGRRRRHFVPEHTFTTAHRWPRRARAAFCA